LVHKDKRAVGIICALICEVLFGFSFLFTKKITETVSAMTLLSWRFIVAFLVINAFILFRIIKVDLRKKSLLPLAVVAIFQPVLYFVGETFGISLTTATESGTIIAMIPVVTLLFSPIVLKEKPSKLQIVGVGIATA
jgi:drug/metabolite transporter (DMT)-like permease